MVRAAVTLILTVTLTVTRLRAAAHALTRAVLAVRAPLHLARGWRAWAAAARVRRGYSPQARRAADGALRLRALQLALRRWRRAELSGVAARVAREAWRRAALACGHRTHQVHPQSEPDGVAGRGREPFRGSTGTPVRRAIEI